MFLLGVLALKRLVVENTCGETWLPPIGPVYCALPDLALREGW